MTDEANSAFTFGFTDAYTEGDSALPYEYAVGSLTSNATDCAMWFHDGDSTTDLFRAATTDTNNDSTIIDSTASDNSWHILALDFDTSGNATAYLDGASKGVIDQALDPTLKYCIYLGFLGRAAAADKIQIDYAFAWQKSAR